MQTNVAHRVRRLTQTPRAFENWAAVLTRMARGPHGPASLTFVTRSGQRISCPNVPGARVPVYEIYAEDCYRLAEFLGTAVREPLQVLDIGAHVGAFACRLAQLAPAAGILCVEPSETTAQYLARNVADNGLTDRVQVVRAAVAAEPGEVWLADNGGGSALNGLSSDGSGTPVTARTIDELVAESGPFDVVKIDCEGGEYDAILASSPQSWASVRFIVLEYHAHPHHGWPELRGWLEEVGFAVTHEDAVTDAHGTAWLVRREP